MGTIEPLSVIGPEVGEITAAALGPGRVVLRWTDNLQSGKVRVPMPCHETQVLLVAAGTRDVQVVCRRCTTTYTLDLLDDGDDGWTARLVVVELPILLTRARQRTYR